MTVDEFQKKVLERFYFAQLEAAALGLLRFTNKTADEIQDFLSGMLWEVQKIAREQDKSIDFRLVS